MAQNLQVGNKVYVPCVRIGLEDRPSALFHTQVEDVSGRSIRVRLPGGITSEPIGTSLVHKNLGIVILRIGDLETEPTLLDPLAKSMLQYCRLLVTDDSLRLVELRSLSELNRWWRGHHAAYSHVVVIAHGRPDAIRFAVDDWVTADALTPQLPTRATNSKVFVSLCCSTGYAAFGQTLSRWKGCGAMIGPFGAVHGAIASQFCQTFLAYQLLEGRSIAVAFRYARRSVPGSASFRLWQKGKLSIATKG
jgi:hypothetical protein